MGPQTSTKEILDEIVSRIISVADPDKIILFGSGARGDMKPNSDLDLLVVKSEPIHRRKLSQEIYMNLFGVGQAVDIIVVTPEDIERYGDTHALVLKAALQDGKVIYERQAVSSG
jgi:predicted nucleotidyltransferase